MSISQISASNSTSYWDELLKTSSSKKSQQSGDLAAALLGDVDVDGNAAISLAESGLDQQTYDFMDTDQDGSLSLEELEQAFELQRQAMLTRVKLPEPSAQGASSASPESSAQDFGAGVSEAGGGQTVFDPLDINQDGFVSPQEQAVATERQQEALNGGADPARSGLARKTRDFLAAMVSRAYSAINGTGASEGSIDLNA
ncbi:MAG: hypothetical protein LBN33_05380 [Desulfovibrio sp.]|jgi:hypothetical protein|nr:hypothetical protein [Desulfovibrio sp.]